MEFPGKPEATKVKIIIVNPLVIFSLSCHFSLLAFLQSWLRSRLHEGRMSFSFAESPPGYSKQPGKCCLGGGNAEG